MTTNMVQEEVPEIVLPENLYLFDERNRDFLKQRSEQIYSPGYNARNDLVSRAVLAAILLIPLVAIFTLLSGFIRDITSRDSNRLELLPTLLIVAALAALIVLVGYGWLMGLRREQADRRQLVREGKIIFVPVEKCTLIRVRGGGRFLSTLPIMRLRCTFISPRSGRSMTRSFATTWPSDGHCIAVGTPIALLFRSYKNFQVL